MKKLVRFRERWDLENGSNKRENFQNKNINIRTVGPVALRLLLIPGIVEALVAGGVMIGVFGMPPLFAIAVGFVIKP